MKKFISVMLSIIAIAAVAAAAAYGIYYFLTKERKPIAVFSSNFDDDPSEDLITDIVDEADCDAVCTVDKCMPY